MRLINRYILREFLQAFCYCMAAFVMMRIVFELFQSLHDFIDYKSPALIVIQYYLLILPSAFAMTLPVSIFFGLLFVLVTMSKNNELTALRAAGLSMLRPSTIIIAVAMVLAATLFAVNELLVPDASERANYIHDTERLKMRAEQGRTSMSSAFIRRNLTYVNHRENRKWRFGSFNTKTLSGEDVIIDYQPTDKPEQTINARFAYWVGKHWVFQDVKIFTYNRTADPNSRVIPESLPSWENPIINDLPEDIALYAKRDPEYMTLKQLRRYLELHPSEDLSEFRVNLEHRYAFPWACVVACLMAIPLGSGSSRRTALVGVASALILFALYFVLYSLGMNIGKSPRKVLDPMVAVWSANALFTFLGAIMMWRIR